MGAGRGGPANCNASREMKFDARRAELQSLLEDYKSQRGAGGSRAATPLGWAPALHPSQSCAGRPAEGVAERGLEVGAARTGGVGGGTAGEKSRTHLDTCPTVESIAYPSLAILIRAMGIATPVAAGRMFYGGKKGGAAGRSLGGWR